MRHTFESLGYQSGFYLSQLFSSNRSPSSSNTSLMGSNHPILPPQTQQLQPSQLPLYNWSGSSQRPMMAQSSMPAYQPHMPFPVMPHANKEPDSDVKWPTGLSFFNALTNNVNAKLLFYSEGSGDKPEHHSQEQSNSEGQANPSEFLSLDSHQLNTSFLEWHHSCMTLVRNLVCFFLYFVCCFWKRCRICRKAPSSLSFSELCLRSVFCFFWPNSTHLNMYYTSSQWAL